MATCTPAPVCDLTCEELTCELNAITTNITNLFSRTDDLRLQVDESPFVVVDDEEELDDALLLGKHILLRGEGNGGEFSLTNSKDVDIPGTKVWGYGYQDSDAVNNYSLLTLDMPTDRIGFNVNTTDVEFCGFECKGNLALSLGAGQQYFFIELSPTVNSARLHIHDIHTHNLNRFVSKNGNASSPVTEDLTVERCYVHTYDGHAMYFIHGMQSAKILNNRNIGRLSGETHTGVIKSVYFAARIFDSLVQGNTCGGDTDEGIELTTIAISADNYYPNYRNKIIGNTVDGTTRFGISLGHGEDCEVIGNTVKDAVGIGIESAGNYATANTNTQFHNLIANNIIRGVTSPSGTSSGISIDKTNGDLVIGNKISEITGLTEARGISVYNANFSQITGNNLSKVGKYGIIVNNGVHPFAPFAAAANTAGYHVIEGNRFKSLASEAGVATHAVYILDTTAFVRNNIALRAAGTTQIYEANCNSPALVYPGFDWTAPLAAGGFLESNLDIAY